MRLPRCRLRLRSLILLVALVALVLFGHRLYQDGPENHWLLLKLRYGDVVARRAAAVQAQELETDAMLYESVARYKFGPQAARILQAQWRRQHRRAELLLPALADAANDPDPACRADALRALHSLALPYASESGKLRALRLVLAATRDRDGAVRTTAVGLVARLAVQDTGAAIAALRSALADPAVGVRQAAARELGWLGAIVPAARPEVVPTLVPLLAGRDDPRVRVKAAWGLCSFGVDRLRDPAAAGPDLVPPLVAALRDPISEVRLAAAVIFGAATTDARGRTVSSWEQRKGSVIPALERALDDEDTSVREEAALALFTLGGRDPAVIGLLEQAAREPHRPRKTKFESALKTWHDEREENLPVEPTDPGEEAP